MQVLSKFICRKFFLFLICSGMISGQPQSIKFERIAREQGMKSGSIQCMLQDHQGFMWFGTPKGLHRYDGYGFTIYNHNVRDSTSLSGGHILSLHEDASGNLWVGTLINGLNMLDRSSGTFVRFGHDPKNPHTLSNPQILCIFEDGTGVLWVGTTGGLNRFDRKQGRITHFMHDPKQSNSLSNDWIRAIYEDRFGTLWVGTASGGLNRLESHDGTFTRFVHDPEDSRSLSSHEVLSFCEDRAGNFWLGTNHGLNLFDRDLERFTRFLNDPSDPYSLSGNFVPAIQEDRMGNLWIGTMGGGLNILDRNSGRFTRYVNDPEDQQSLSSNYITSLFQDPTGTIWVGTGDLRGMAKGGGFGINRYDPGQDRFHRFAAIPPNPDRKNSMSLLDVFEDHSGAIWMTSYREGLFKYDTATQTIRQFLHDPENPGSLSQNFNLSIYEDRDSVLWVGSFNRGLNRYDRNTGMFQQYAHRPDDPNSLSQNQVNSILEDRDGNFWLGTFGGGLNKFDRKNRIFNHFKHVPDDPHSISSNFLSRIYEDRSGMLWIGTWSGGLNRFDRERGHFYRYANDPANPHSLSNNIIRSIFEDRSGNFWVGTSRGGLNRLDRDTGKFHFYTEEDGLPDNSISGIIEDNRGYLWLTTGSALSKFDPRAETFKNFDINDGLHNQEFKGAARRDGSGEIFLAGSNGIDFFHPDSIRDNPHIPPVVITRLTHHTSGDNGGTITVDNQISRKRHVDLSYLDQTLTFDFVALNYRSSHKNQYAYRLEGAQDDWIQLGNRRSITFTNLPSGSYTLRVKAANNDGVWNEADASLKFTIHPPWWHTRWAYGGYFLLFVGVIYTIYRSELNRQRKDILLKESRQRTKLAEERAKERAEMLEIVEKKNSELDEKNRKIIETQEQLIVQEKLASLGQLTAGIAHEIKNPLNFVNNFSELSIELLTELREDFNQNQEKLDNDTIANIEDILHMLESNAGKINEHGKRADGIVKGMLEHSRGKSGEFQTVDLNDLLEENVNIAYHGMRARNEEFNVTIEKEYDESIGKIPVVPPDISRVFLNILNNAFEAVQEIEGDRPPTVWITAANRGETVEIRIRDNGPGIPEKIRKEIFNPFFTTKPTGMGNTGLGLSISHDIVVKVHRGEIRLETEAGKFSGFIITLPRG